MSGTPTATGETKGHELRGDRMDLSKEIADYESRVLALHVGQSGVGGSPAAFDQLYEEVSRGSKSSGS